MKILRPSFFTALTFVIAIGCSAIFGAPASAKVFSPETFRLANGMEVIVISNHRAPIVTHMVWYKVGSADEPRGKSGIAHFFEHLMFKRTKNLASGEFSKIVARNGGRDNAFTSYDYTAYHQSVAVDRLETVMKLEAERMRNLLFDPEQVEPERLVVLEERRSRTDNSPGARLGEQMNATMFMNYPYRDPIIGWEHEIRGLTIADLKTFYDRWYVPNNAILVVAGDVTAADVKPLAEKYYGVIPRGPDIERVRTVEPPHNAALQVTLRDPQVRQDSWQRAYLAPSRGYGEKQHAYPLDMLTEILGGSTGRLYTSLVIDQQIAVSAGAFYDANRIGPSEFTIYASPQPGVSIEKLEAAVEAEIQKLLRDGVTADEVARAKDRMLASAIYARDSARQAARVLGAALATGRTVADVEEWPDRIGTVAKDHVDEAAKAVLVKKRSVTGLLLAEQRS